jgi:UDP-N-acetylmuramoyl-tripeptide--D-alanyl-D-alanine ligase
MRAALRALAGMRRDPGRTVAVIGGMLELGEDSDAEHEGIGRLAAELGIDQLVVVGEVAAPAVAGYTAAGGAEVSPVGDRDAAGALLADRLAPGDVALFKSSRDSGLRHLGDELAGVDG